MMATESNSATRSRAKRAASSASLLYAPRVNFCTDRHRSSLRPFLYWLAPILCQICAPHKCDNLKLQVPRVSPIAATLNRSTASTASKSTHTAHWQSWPTVKNIVTIVRPPLEDLPTDPVITDSMRKR
nr:hypothetical protein CFP56_73980 [Quercus suber]